MKRLLAMLLALFTSIFSGVNYQVSGEKPYANNIYYTIDEADAPDYRTLYDKSFVAESNTTGCKTANYSEGQQYVIYNGVSTTHKGYWFIANDTVVADDNIKFKTIDIGASDAYIICPYDATLLSTSMTNDGHSMQLRVELNGNAYNLLFENMDRWYCCMSRTNPLFDNNGNEVWQHTSSEQKGHTFNAGNVLGRATDNTTVRITAVSGDDTVTMYDLFVN